MKNKWMKKLLMVGAVATMLFSTSVPAFAYVDETQTTEAVLEEEFIGEEVQTEETAETGTETGTETETTETAGDAFSVEGNGTVLDDVVDTASGKEFYTIQTANNNTYFMVIDHSSTAQNVYMLSMIDENDLKEFLDEDTETETEAAVTQPTVVIEEDSTETETEAVVDTTTADAKNTGSNTVGVLAILAAIGAAVAGGYYYLKFYKPKKDGAFSDDEDLEYMDDGETVNEDESDNAYEKEEQDDEDGYYLDDDEE